MRATVSLLLLLASAVASAQDRAASLYSTAIAFDQDNVPVVTVGLMEEQRSIAIETKGPLRILPDGPRGAELVTGGGRRWTAHVEGGRPARTTWRVQVAALGAGDLEAIQAERKLWRERQVVVTTFELGSVFGFFGKVLDNRRVVVATETKYPTREAAETAATTLAAAHGVETSVLPVLEERSHGTVVLTDGEATVRTDDVVWLEAATAGETVTVKDVEFGKGFPWHGREDRRYRGMLYLAVDRTGQLAVVNRVPSEVLLRGLVPAEIYPTAPAAALQAQAVSARGELLAKLGHRHLADPYLICGDVHCQVYAGVHKEDSRTDRAVESTRGEMLFEAGTLVDTVYSACCGGHTEHNDNVWPGAPQRTLRGHPDGDVVLGTPTEAAVRAWVTSRPKAYCGQTAFAKDSFRWTKVVPVEALRQTVKARHQDPGVIRTVKVTKRGVSGRALVAEVKGDDRTVTLEGELTIRKAFGGLKSALFVVDADPGAFRFTGGGFGHGVGLCQTGAIGMSEQGSGYKAILEHYFQGATVERIY